MTNADISTRRMLQVIDSARELFQLDLSGFNVLTEAASGAFVVTPLITALSGAKVHVFAQDSVYGSKREVLDNLERHAKEFGVSKAIEVIERTDSDKIKNCDLITNLGFVRPIDSSLTSLLKANSVIAAMCEAWEVRDEDIDISACRVKEIPVVAVNEESKYKNIFNYVGYLTLKLLFEAGLDIYSDKFLIIGSDKFSHKIVEILNKLNVQSILLPLNEIHNYSPTNNNIDGIIVADYTSFEMIIDQSATLNEQWLKKNTPFAKIIHIAGGVNHEYLKSIGFDCYPFYSGLPRRMSKTLAHLGVRPVVELHTSGLKAAEIVLRELRSGASIVEVKDKYKNHHLIQLMD